MVLSPQSSPQNKRGIDRVGMVLEYVPMWELLMRMFHGLTMNIIMDQILCLFIFLFPLKERIYTIYHALYVYIHGMALP